MYSVISQEKNVAYVKIITFMNLLILNKNTKKALGKGKGKGKEKRPAESEWAHQKSSHYAEPCEGPPSIKLQKKIQKLISTCDNQNASY
jgi:hypothetical protein